MTEILKKYWWAFFAIIAAPVALNFILRIPAFIQFVGNDTDWLTFWGNYLGGCVGALIALFVLHKTLQQNHEENIENRRASREENERNRIANERANEANRQLQIKVLKYQQESFWLNNFRVACAEYIQLYNYNDVVNVVNTMANNPRQAFDLLKELYNRAIKLDAQFAYSRKPGENMVRLMNCIGPMYTLYIEVLNDIQRFITYRIAQPAPSLSTFTSYIDESGSNVSDEMKTILTDHRFRQNNENIFVILNDMAITRVNRIDGCEAKIRDEIYGYIQSEQIRIDRILEESDMKAAGK
ncbi:MAG: hypothetical protein NC209_05625 [Alistipes sp.]|nr:hypothetical protein [Alistipes senegalensis]MCM1250604.1 hypothetical protein [Alistipes sp.]